jgi:hypothetical protein
MQRPNRNACLLRDRGIAHAGGAHTGHAGPLGNGPDAGPVEGGDGDHHASQTPSTMPIPTDPKAMRRALKIMRPLVR